MTAMCEIEILEAFSEMPGANVKAMALALGVGYQERSLGGVYSSQIECLGPRKYGITVCTSLADQQRRFAAAHEIGHYLLHRDLMDEAGRSVHRDILFGDAAGSNDPVPFLKEYEIQANRMAARIMMPKQLLSKMFNPVHDNTGELAERFMVSRRAMRIRLGQLGLVRKTENERPNGKFGMPKKNEVQ